MSKVITFSLVYPKHHPRAGASTDFIAKIWKGLPLSDRLSSAYFETRENLSRKEEVAPKYTTVREGNRFKKGDTFSPRYWRGRPYWTEQVLIANDLTVKNVWTIERDGQGNFYVPQAKATTTIEMIALNDGLTLDDFKGWFNRPFKGQIITWSDAVGY